MEVPRSLSFDIKEGKRTISHVFFTVDEGKFYNDLYESDFKWMLDESGSWEELMFFLRSRIFPKRDDGYKDLEMLGLKKYDVFEILKKTNGKMFHDDISIENLKFL